MINPPIKGGKLMCRKTNLALLIFSKIKLILFILFITLSQPSFAVKLKNASPKNKLTKIISELEPSSTKNGKFFPSAVKKLVSERNIKVEKISAPALIPYRSEGKGKGAFYDHYTFQRLTKHGSVTDAIEEELQELGKYATTTTVALIGEIETASGSVVPFSSPAAQAQAGLLIIPGRMRENEYCTARAQRENKLIQKARNCGQPILGICAGSWRLWESFGGTLKPVKDHCYGGGMIRMGENGRIAYNVQIHGVKIKDDSRLARAIGFQKDDLPEGEDSHSLLVNSVHWKAPDAESTPENMAICATAIQIPTIEIKTRQGVLMEPESDSVEAFETIHGALTLGTLWHLEGYNPDDAKKHTSRATVYFSPEKHIHLFCEMAKAGDDFAMKRQMLREFDDILRLVEMK